MSILVKNIRKHLECAICLERYVNPKQLNCPHVFCKSCIDMALEFHTDGSAVITCPQCRKETYIGSTETSNDLATNIILNGILDDSVTSSEDSSEKVVCTGNINCDNKISSFCLECRSFLCKTCVRKNHIFHANASINVGVNNTLSVLCETHKTRCDYMCCDDDVVCIYCVHRTNGNHNYTTLEYQVELIKQTLLAEIEKNETVSKISSVVKQSISTSEKRFEKTLQSRKITCLSKYMKLLNKEEQILREEFKRIQSNHKNQFVVSTAPLKEILKSTNVEMCLLKESILQGILIHREPEDFQCHTVRLLETGLNNKHPLGELYVESEVVDVHDLENMVSTFIYDGPYENEAPADALLLQVTELVDQLATLLKNGDDEVQNEDVSGDSLDETEDDIEVEEKEFLEEFDDQSYYSRLRWVENLIRNDDEDTLNLLLATRHSDVVKMGENCDHSPLRYAVRYDRLKMVTQLVDCGCYVDGQSTYGETILHCASVNSLECLIWLCETQSHLINIQDDFGDTPLHYAAYNNKLNCVKVLCKHADVDITNNTGKTALDIAKRRRNYTCANEIEKV